MDKLFVSSLREIKNLVFNVRDPALQQLWQLVRQRLSGSGANGSNDKGVFYEISPQVCPQVFY